MRVLIVEDEVDLAGAVRRAFEDEGFACDAVHTGTRGLHEVLHHDYDLVILDLMLPGVDGRTILERLRERKPTPVLMLTARDGVGDKVRMFDSGADDYLTKPFELAELIARSRALIRRAARDPRPVLRIGPVCLDTVGRTVSRDGEPVLLTPKEFALVEYLARHRGEVVARARIYDHIYDGSDDTLSNVLDVYVSNVRRKLGRDFIRTRRGEGYVIPDGPGSG